jgi:hypothetical protein
VSRASDLDPIGLHFGVRLLENRMVAYYVNWNKTLLVWLDLGLMLQLHGVVH